MIKAISMVKSSAIRPIRASLQKNGILKPLSGPTDSFTKNPTFLRPDGNGIPNVQIQFDSFNRHSIKYDNLKDVTNETKSIPNVNDMTINDFKADGTVQQTNINFKGNPHEAAETSKVTEAINAPEVPEVPQTTTIIEPVEIPEMPDSEGNGIFRTLIDLFLGF